MQEIAYAGTFSHYLSYTTKKLCAAYFLLEREELLLRMRRDTRSVAGDVISFDASRVSCREILLLTLFMCDMLIGFPLQQMPDSAMLMDIGRALVSLDPSLITMTAGAPSPDIIMAMKKHLGKVGAATKVEIATHSLYMNRSIFEQVLSINTKYGKVECI